MKIAQVNISDQGGGAERSVVSLHLGLLEHGHESVLFVKNQYTSLPGVVKIPYKRGLPGGRRLARMIEKYTGWQDIYNPSFRALERLIAPDTDIVHFNNIWGSTDGTFGDIGALPSITERIPAVLTEHQNWFFTGHCAYFRDCMRWQEGCGKCPDLTIPPSVERDGTRLNWWRKKRSVSRSDITFVGISDWVTHLAEQSPIWAGKRKETISEGIDTSVFHPVSTAEKLELRSELGIPLDRKVVLITGQTLEGYANGFAPQGVSASLRLDYRKVLLLLVGRSSDKVAQLTDFPSVALPFQKEPQEMARCYQVADLNLSASRVEAFGCIAAEAQACGIPVIATAVGGLAEVVRNGIGGFSIASGDTDGLLAGLNKLIGDEDLCRKLGIQGRQFVMENYSVKKVVAKYISLYEEIIFSRRKGKSS